MLQLSTTDVWSMAERCVVLLDSHLANVTRAQMMIVNVTLNVQTFSIAVTTIRLYAVRNMLND